MFRSTNKYESWISIIVDIYKTDNLQRSQKMKIEKVKDQQIIRVKGDKTYLTKIMIKYPSSRPKILASFWQHLW